MRCLWIMFVTAVCFLFLLKLKWPKNKNIYDVTLFCYVFVLFCSVFFSLIFQADTNSILFHLVVENLILHIFLIITIMPCFGMFRNVPGCSGMFHVPGSIDARKEMRDGENVQNRTMFVYHVLRLWQSSRLSIILMPFSNLHRSFIMLNSEFPRLAK